MKAKSMNFLSRLSRDEMSTAMGGCGDGCSGTAECSADCPCENAEDWCDNGFCDERPY